MHSIDHAVHKSLFALQCGYDALLSVRQTVGEAYLTKKAELDQRWQADMLPVMEDLYWHPLANGIDETPDNEDDLRAWLQRRYRDATVVAALLALLKRYQVKAYNLGGQTGLDMLGMDGTFRLTNESILAELERHAEELTTQGTDVSLIDTTIDDLAVAIPNAKGSAGSAALFIAAYIALRSATRTETIERTERPLQVADALVETYQRNGISYVMYDVNGIGCQRICAPWHGRVFPAGARGTYIPQHPRCDCIWSPVRYDGQAVGWPAVTVSVPGLQPWVTPAIIWMGN